MAGAGREHNSIGLIILAEIEPDLRCQLTENFPAVADVRVYFEPPRMGVAGDIHIQLDSEADCDVNMLIHETFAIRCANFDVARIIRRVIVVNNDIDIGKRREVDWATSVRATRAEQFLLLNDLPAAGSALRIGINATENPDEKDKFRRPSTPGSESIHLDDYLN
jgi:UbiD family decarboxylase